MPTIEKLTVARFAGMPEKMDPKYFRKIIKADINDVNKVMSFDLLHGIRGEGMPGSIHTLLCDLTLFKRTDVDQEAYKYSTKLQLVADSYASVAHSISQGVSFSTINDNIARDIYMYIGKQEFHGQGSAFASKSSNIVAFRNLRQNPVPFIGMLVRASASYIFLAKNYGHVLKESNELVYGNKERLEFVVPDDREGFMRSFLYQLYLSKGRDYVKFRKDWLSGDFDFKNSLKP